MLYRGIVEVLKTFRIYRLAITEQRKKVFWELSAGRIYLQKKKKKNTINVEMFY